MIIPVRCFTCGKIIGNKYERYTELLKIEYTEGDVLDVSELKRIYYRQMVLTHVGLIDNLLLYSSYKKNYDIEFNR